MPLKSPLKTDLNFLFQPALADGLATLDAYESKFSDIHQGIHALRITGQLAFARLVTDDKMLSQVLLCAENYKGARNIVVFGIGGSALGAKSLYHALYGPLKAIESQKKIFFMDNIDPHTHENLVHLIGADNKDTVFVFISKSGNTSETLAQYLFAEKHFTHFDEGNVIVITDPQNGCLRELAKKKKHVMLLVPPGVGGRFSVFSPVGLLPLALMGVAVDELIAGAKQAERACQTDVLAHNPAGVIACALDYWAREKSVTQLVIMPYADRLLYFADWAAQLFAESLNKATTLTGEKPKYGMTVLKALGTTDQHSQLQLYLDGARDKVVFFIDCADTPAGTLSDKSSGDDRLDFLAGRGLADLLAAEKIATEESLRANARPSATITLATLNPFQLGQLYQIFMHVVPYVGGFLDINPYDQPAVEQIKKFTFGLMGKKGFEDFNQESLQKNKKDEFIF